MKKLVLIFIILTLNLTAAESWKNEKYLWEKKFDNLGAVEFITGGDINGDMKDDIVVIYGKSENNKIEAAVTVGSDYKKVELDERWLKYLGIDEFSQFKSIEIKDEKIYTKTMLNINSFIKEINGNSESMIVFDYSRDKLNIVDVVGSGKVEFTEQTAQYFYNVKEGYVYYNYLEREQKIGESNSYYYRNYSRVVAPEVSSMTVNCDEDKWILKAGSNRVDSSWMKMEVTYGFEKWKNDFDLSVKYYVAHDEENIYILAKVSDDIFRQNFSGDKGLRGDHLELWFGDESGNKYQIALLPGNFAAVKGEAMQWYLGSRAVSNKKVVNAVVAGKKSDNGYIIEAKLPISSIGISSLRDITRFTLAVSDSDSADKQEKLMASSSLTWGYDRSMGEIIWE